MAAGPQGATLVCGKRGALRHRPHPPCCLTRVGYLPPRCADAFSQGGSATMRRNPPDWVAESRRRPLHATLSLADGMTKALIGGITTGSPAASTSASASSAEWTCIVSNSRPPSSSAAPEAVSRQAWIHCSRGLVTARIAATTSQLKGGSRPGSGTGRAGPSASREVAPASPLTPVRARTRMSCLASASSALCARTGSSFFTTCRLRFRLGFSSEASSDAPQSSPDASVWSSSSQRG